MERSITDPAAFGPIFDRHFVRIHRYLARRAGSQTADDLAAEVFTVAFAQRHRFDRSRADALPWLYGIASNLLRADRRARRNASRLLQRLLRFDEPDHSIEDGAVDAITARARAARLVPVFSGLSDDDTQTLLLYAWEELTYEQVAEALGIPVGTVRSRLNRIRRKAVATAPADDDSKGRAR